MTIQASDFVYEPTTAPVVLAGDPIDLGDGRNGETGLSSRRPADAFRLGSTVSDGVLIADGNWTVQTTKSASASMPLETRIDSIGHAKSISSDEVRTHSTEYTDDDAVITLASGHRQIELHRGHATPPMEKNFTFDQSPVLDSAGAMTISNGAVMAQNGSIHNTAALNVADDRAELRLVKHGLTQRARTGSCHLTAIGRFVLERVTLPTLMSTQSILVQRRAQRRSPESVGEWRRIISISGEASEHRHRHTCMAAARLIRAILNCSCGVRLRGCRCAPLATRFHFKVEISGFEDFRCHRPRRCGPYPGVDQSSRKRCRNWRTRRSASDRATSAGADLG